MSRLKIKRKRMSRIQTIAFGYLLVLVLGTLLLMLPFSSKTGEATDFLTALFTATSATCVTGLVVVDTCTYWSVIGQIIILIMIQIGGLGFMTMGVLLFMFMKRKISLSTRGLLQESMNMNQVGGVVKMAKTALIGTALIEGIGAVLLAFRFIPEFGIPKGIYYSIFHSVSAFCNAGFDLMGERYGEYASLVGYKGDILINVVVSALIIVGGIGFSVWNDVRMHRLEIKKYTLHSKLAISCTIGLLLGGTLLFYLFEKDNLMAEMGVKDTILTSFFSSVTARTAGYNTIDTGALTSASKLTTILLMFVGGSPGSTAGGIKTVTLMVLFVYVWSNLRGERGSNVFNRRLEEDSIRKASIVTIVSLVMAMTAALVISFLQALPMEDIMFEVFSAIGTVGMTTGITRQLETIPRIIIILLMYCGRIGSMSFALSFMEKRKVPPVQLPAEKVMIG